MSWLQAGQIIIGQRETEHVRIEVLGPVSDSFWSSNVEVACGIWKGSFDWQIYEGELHRFGQEVRELHRRLCGTAVLEPLEPSLTLKMVGDGKGHITVTGRAEADFSANTYLVFRFELDQTELPAIAAALLAADPA